MALLVYHSLAVAVGASLGVIGGLAGLIVAIVLFCLLLMWWVWWTTANAIHWQTQDWADVLLQILARWVRSLCKVRVTDGQPHCHHCQAWLGDDHSASVGQEWGTSYLHSLIVQWSSKVLHRACLCEYVLVTTELLWSNVFPRVRSTQGRGQ